MRYTIEIDQLQEKIDSLGEELILIDVRPDRKGGPIQGAVKLNIKEHIAGEEHFFLAPDQMATHLGHFGIDEQKTLVFIDNGSNRQSARALFALYQLGHEGGLHILQGGFPVWQAASLSYEGIRRRKVTYHYNVRKGAVLSYEEVKDKLPKDSVVLIDSRSYRRYAGFEEPKYKKAGHIPSAVNFHAKKVFDEQGKWHDVAKLKEVFSSIEDKEQVIASCGSGGSACLNAVALLEAGFENVALYPGGYSEWLAKGEEVATQKKDDCD